MVTQQQERVIASMRESVTDWIEPHKTTGESGESSLEWWCGSRELTVYISTSGSADYVISWGADPDTEMSDGELGKPWTFKMLWSWLHSWQQ